MQSSEEPIAVCIIVENVSSPNDRRVWQEATALTEAGYRVSIICPKGPGAQEDYVRKEGIEIFRHSSREGEGVLGYIREYSWALWCEFRLALRVYRRTRFRILQACNPPENIFLIAWFFGLVFGTRFIFDHHDPSPELYETRYRNRGLLYWILRSWEWLTFRAADAVITTSDSMKRIALTRGKCPSDQVFVVRSCPDLNRFQLPAARSGLKEGREHLVVYLGCMGPQDGLDLLLESIHHLVHRQGRRDTTFALIGPGSEVERLKRRSAELGLEPYVTFTGGVYGESLLAYLATADVGVAPDPVNKFNDGLVMLKILEYMACGIPTVLYKLTEGRRIAGNAALYANDPVDFAQSISQLLDSPDLRHQLGRTAQKRVRIDLNWQIEKQRLFDAYQAVSGGTSPVAASFPDVVSQKL